MKLYSRCPYFIWLWFMPWKCLLWFSEKYQFLPLEEKINKCSFGEDSLVWMVNIANQPVQATQLIERHDKWQAPLIVSISFRSSRSNFLWLLPSF